MRIVGTNILATAILAAGLCAQASTPILSQPRSFPRSGRAGGSWDAWGDSLYASGGGFIFRYVRKGDAVVVLDSLRNDTIFAMYPRVLRDSSGSNVLVTNHSIFLLSASMFAGGGKNPSWWPKNLLEYDTSLNLDDDKRITGGVVSGNPESMFLCGGNGGGRMSEDIQADGSLSLGFQALHSGIDYLCDIDNVAQQG